IKVQLRGLHFFRKLFAQRFFHFFHFDVEQLRDNTDVDHIADEFAQLGFRAYRSYQFVEGNGVEDQIVADGTQVQRLVVEHDRAGIERFDIFLRGFRVHGYQEVNFLLASDVTILVGANGVPGGQTGDIGREQILAGNRYSHLKNTAKQDAIGTLRPRAVYRRDLNT